MATAPKAADSPSSSKGRARAERIVDAATALLIGQGYAGFSLRSVADSLGMRLSNVQYYFAGRSALLGAIFARSLERSLRTMEERQLGNDLSAAVGFVLEDQLSEGSCRMFWDLWALSARDPEAASVMDAYYAQVRRRLEELLAGVSPALDQEQRRRRALVIVSLLEGLSLFRGAGRALDVDRTALDRDVVALIREFASGPPPSV